jgi:hypothetical protein
MDLIGSYSDQEFGPVKLLMLQEETASSWNDIKDDLSDSVEEENKVVVHRLFTDFIKLCEFA